ncbi:uncharacterized protein LOC142327300 [Lycorma delicatula]|uniref:uncharacterized protein LOC142327300 n=1 Tax=Lycorma delicatula TaxID=130591 RepID=UPI003F50FBC9
MSQQSAERNIPHLRDIFGFQREEKKCDNHQDSSGNGGNDSAISVGSTSEEELSMLTSPNTKKKKQQRKKEKLMTETDVKHLERHLSMKKTIRKKIMRDLQQAFVEDPNEFRVEDIPREQLKAEINLQSLSFGASGKKKGKKTNGESNFLDFLRTGDSKVSSNNVLNDDDSGHGSPTRELSTERPHDDQDDDDDTNKKTSFWRRFTMKGRNKR